MRGDRARPPTSATAPRSRARCRRRARTRSRIWPPSRPSPTPGTGSARSGTSMPRGTLNVVLAVAEHAPAARLLVTSSAEVYGRIAEDEGRRGRGHGARADLAVRPLEGRGGDRLRAGGSRRRGRAPVPAHGPGPERDASPSRRSPAQIARIEAGLAPPVDQGRQPRRAARLLRRALRGRRLRAAARAARRPARLQRRHRQCASAWRRCSTACSPWPRWRSASRSTRRACGPPTSRLLVGSPRRLIEATGWRPTRSLDETLADVLNAARQGVATE